VILQLPVAVPLISLLLFFLLLLLLLSPLQELHGIALKSSEDRNKDNVAISRSHTGAGADVVTSYIPDHQPLFAGGSGYKALAVLKVSSSSSSSSSGRRRRRRRRRRKIG